MCITEKLSRIVLPRALPKTIPKLNVLNCIEVATSLPVSTCLVTAVWNIETSAPNETPHKKKPIWATMNTSPNLQIRTLFQKLRIT